VLLQASLVTAAFAAAVAGARMLGASARSTLIVAIAGLVVAIALLRRPEAPSPAEPDPSAATYRERAGPERRRAGEYSGA
jgi:hypothetical protein